jgi:hypothetical protein
LKTLLLLLASARLSCAQTNLINYCSTIHAHESADNGAYQIPVLLGTPHAGMIDELSFLASERTNGPSPTVRLSISANFTSLSTLGVLPAQTVPTFFREYTINNGMAMTRIDPNLWATNCTENTNLFLIRLPVKAIVPANNYLMLWFPAGHLNWQIPPYYPPTGQAAVPKVYQSCRYTRPAGGWGYYFKPLHEISVYYDIPYWINFRPSLSIGQSGGNVVVSWPATNETNLWLSGNHILISAVTNSYVFPATNTADIFQLRQQ